MKWIMIELLIRQEILLKTFIGIGQEVNESGSKKKLEEKVIMKRVGIFSTILVSQM